MQVGTIVILKVDCLGNKAGTLGVVFYDYNEGVQAIFENGKYDGFSHMNKLGTGNEEIESEFFLQEVGYERKLSDYQFQNVIKLEEDFRKGMFNAAWSQAWKANAAEMSKCRICGCTNEKACEGGCFWALPGICSKCVTKEVPECIDLLIETILETHQPDEIDKDHHGDKHPCSTCELIKVAKNIGTQLQRR